MPNIIDNEQETLHIESNNIYNGLETYCTIMPRGHRCGYVVIESGIRLDDKDISQLIVHGGITYEGSSYDRFDGKYVIGFDCAHIGDAADFKTAKKVYKNSPDTVAVLKAIEKVESEFSKNGDNIKTQRFVESELKSLTKQISKILASRN